MKEIICIKTASTNKYLGFVRANEKSEVTEKEFLRFADRARRLFGIQVNMLDLLAQDKIVIVRKGKYEICPIIPAPIEFDRDKDCYVNTFWKGIQHERFIS